MLETGVLYGDPDSGDIMEGTRSLGELCWKRLTSFGDNIVLINGHTGETLTANELRDRSRKVTEALRRIGIGPSDNVGLCAENRFEFAYIFFGTIFLGAKLTLLNPNYSEAELRHAVQLTKPTIVFVTASAANKIKHIAVQYKFIEKTYVLDEEHISGLKKYSELLSKVNGNDIVDNFNIETQNVKEKIAFILFSSGTTGQPKGVQLSQWNTILASSRMIHHVLNTLDEEPVSLSIVPWFHTYGCHRLLISAIIGTKVVNLSSFEPHSYLSTIEKYRITTIFVAPPIMVFLAKSPLVDQYDLSSVRRINCGAATLSEALQDAVHKRLNAPAILQGYGMTEGTHCFTRQSDNFCTPGSVGRLQIGLYGRVVDQDSGRVLGPNETGELQFRGSNMVGYIGDVKATNEIIGQDGWLKSGDIGYYNDRHEWFVVDRLKELIKYKGFQVPPAEIERLLLKHPKIADAGVIGLADERAGELPLAFVVKQSNVTLSEKEVIDYVAGKLSVAKHLHGGVRFVEAIPKNPSGKILRRELRRLANKSKL